MSATRTVADGRGIQAAADDDLMHITCCDDNRSLCGLDMTDVPWTDGETDCVVCLDLQETPCCDGCDW